MTMKKPGALHRKNVQITLNTISAIHIYYGREPVDKKTYIMGFDSYLKRLHQMERSIRNDDPFADRSYHEAELQIKAAHEALKEIERALMQDMDKYHSRLRISDLESSDPVVINIEHQSALGIASLETLLFADDLFMAILDLQSAGQYSREEARNLTRKVQRIVRNAIVGTRQYRWSRITRQDIQDETYEAMKVLEKKGGIEPEYLDRSLKSSYAPDVTRKHPVTKEAMPLESSDDHDDDHDFDYDYDDSDRNNDRSANFKDDFPAKRREPLDFRRQMELREKEPKGFFERLFS